MNSESRFKNSIWNNSGKYSIVELNIEDEDKKALSRLMEIDAAKKQVPPVPIRDLLRISSLIKAMPNSVSATCENVSAFLSTTHSLHGVGIKTLICMLAVESDGDYPPMDRKFAKGMKEAGAISAADEEILNSSNSVGFSAVYVGKVIPAWTRSLVGRSPEEADNYWANGGKDG